jgi:uncharacterized protein (DUF608 family)
MTTRFLFCLCLVSLPAHAGAPFNPYPAQIASPLDDASFSRLSLNSDGKTPVINKLHPAWVKSLADRGEPQVYTKANSNNFAYLGMPICGIGSGDLYIGGDGRLWVWDIFNTRAGGGDGFPVDLIGAYKTPNVEAAASDNFQTVLAQGFALQTKTGGKVDTRALDKDGFADIRFRGQYPIGYVDYTDPACPVTVGLEAFSPFNPGNVADSSFPATILNYTLTNTSNQPVDCTLGGWLENGNGLYEKGDGNVLLCAAAEKNPGCPLVSLSAQQAAPEPDDRTETIADFNSGNYANWTAEGTAFGSQPTSIHDYAYDYHVVGMVDDYFIDSFLDQKDEATGKLTSKPFTIDRPFIRFLLSGSKQPNQECINLLIDGQVAETATGGGDDVFHPVSWDVKKYQGKTAQIQIVDALSTKDGHIRIDHITQGDLENLPQKPLSSHEDIGTMALASLGDAGAVEIIPQLTGPDYAHSIFDAPPAESAQFHVPPRDTASKLVSGVRCHVTLAPGQKVTLSFVVAWHFPNPLPLRLRTANNRQYGVRFKSASDVATHIAADFKRLADVTRLWHDTWYDSTLPWWFITRTFTNVSTLSTGTAYILADGRFYGFEGRYSCPGTCTHVWGYQPAMGYLFPELEKSVMEKVEFVPGLGMDSQGCVGMRGEFWKGAATDGQAGIILRTYLAHKMSADDSFLKRNYVSIKKAMNYLVNTSDSAHAGVLVGGQPNTMDNTWWGKIPWMTLHYQAALRATAEMADVTGDHPYATDLRAIADKGRDYVENHLWNGEYFFAEADPNQGGATSTYDGCPLEQLMGQSWAFTVGLGDIVDPQKAAHAIDSIWKYNYTTDAALYRQTYKEGRWYGMKDESALIMCTFPKAAPDGKDKGDWNGPGFCTYDNEIWTGSEYEIATAMMWEGQVDKALAAVRSIDDRYNGAKRNPWDEAECGSHYSRAMASYGTYIAACGYEYDGPKGTMAFAPRVNPQDFQTAFTSAEGWGSFSQKYDGTALAASLSLRHGGLRLKTLSLILPSGNSSKDIEVECAGKAVPASARVTSNRISLTFASEVSLEAGQSLKISVK